MPAPESARRPNVDIVSVAAATREEIRAERLKAAKAAAKQKRREDLLGHLMILLFCGVLGSFCLWLIVVLWRAILG